MKRRNFGKLVGTVILGLPVLGSQWADTGETDELIINVYLDKRPAAYNNDGHLTFLHPVWVTMKYRNCEAVFVMHPGKYHHNKAAFEIDFKSKSLYNLYQINKSISEGEVKRDRPFDYDVTMKRLESKLPEVLKMAKIG